MTFHKKAEDVAEKVYQSWCEIDTPREQLHRRIVSEIAAALVAFAEERVQEYINRSLDKNTAFNKAMFRQGYDAALEEAANIADDHALVKGAHIHRGFKYCVEEVASEIRARAKEV